MVRAARDLVTALLDGARGAAGPAERRDPVTACRSRGCCWPRCCSGSAWWRPSPGPTSPGSGAGAWLPSAPPLYGPTRSALLPAAAVDTGWPLDWRINGLFEHGAAPAVVGGIYAEPVAVRPPRRGSARAGTGDPRPVRGGGRRRAAGRVPERRLPPRAGRRRGPRLLQRRGPHLGRGGRGVRTCLLGLAGLRGPPRAWPAPCCPASSRGSARARPEPPSIAGWVAAGMAVGSLLAGLQRHPRRVLGLVPVGATGLHGRARPPGAAWAVRSQILRRGASPAGGRAPPWPRCTRPSCRPTPAATAWRSAT